MPPNPHATSPFLSFLLFLFHFLLSFSFLFSFPCLSFSLSFSLSSFSFSFSFAFSFFFSSSVVAIRLWEKPKEFRPERFLDLKEQPSPYKFIAFNAGPRLCLGMSMAYLQAKILLISLMQQFHFTLADGSRRRRRRKKSNEIEEKMVCQFGWASFFFYFPHFSLTRKLRARLCGDAYFANEGRPACARHRPSVTSDISFHDIDIDALSHVC